MQKLSLLFIMIFLSFTISAQVTRPNSIIINGQVTKLYYLSPADLGIASNVVAITNQKLYAAALAKGYKLCSYSVAKELSKNFSDETTGTDWDLSTSISICISYSADEVTIVDIGKDGSGEFCKIDTRRGVDYQSFFDTNRKYMVFTR